MASRKPHLDTRGALVRSAWALWSTQGYAHTSVNAIIAHAGLSKGTFYHWFSAQTDLVDAVADLMVERALSQVRADTPAEGTALEQLRTFLASSRAWRFAHAPGYREVAAVLYDPANRELRLRVRQRTERIATRELQRILSRALEDGSLEVHDPELTAEYLVHTGQALADLQIRDLLTGSPEVVDRVVERAVLHLRWMESGLGLSPGTLSALGGGFRDGLTRFLAPQEAP